MYVCSVLEIPASSSFILNYLTLYYSQSSSYVPI